MALMPFDQQNYFDVQQPNENQYLTGNPSTQNGANTDWMDAGTDWTKYGGWSNGAGSSQTNTPPPSGTALGTIGSGGGLFAGGQSYLQPGQMPGMTNLGNGVFGSSYTAPGQGMQQQGTTQAGGLGQYTPEGYDIGKLNDPANANSTKYQVGRILSNFPPGPEGLQQAAPQLAALGITVLGRDKIRLPDGTTADVGRAFSDPNSTKAWQYNWSGLDNGGGGGFQGGPAQGNPFQSFMNPGLNFGGGGGPMQGGGGNNFMHMLYQMMQRQRNQGGGQMFNPIGGGFGNGGGQMYLGGGVIDPITGQRRNPRPGEPQ